MGKFVFIDNSNFFIEGQRISAVEKKLAPNIFEAMNNRVLDQEYRVDFGKLMYYLSEGNIDNINKAILFGSRPPKNDSLWTMIEQSGFDVIVEDRNAANKEKRIDTGIVSSMCKYAYKECNNEHDEIVLVAGDGDYIPPVRDFLDENYKVTVAFWSNASSELKRIASNYINMDTILREIEYER